MRVLLDSHALLWFAAGDGRLTAKVRQLIEDPQNDRFVSVATLWEIAIKYSLGRLELSIPLEDLFGVQIEQNGLILLDVSKAHLLELAIIPYLHRDPFDRLLVA